jgi:hypothetical protein
MLGIGSKEKRKAALKDWETFCNSKTPKFRLVA